MTIRTGITRRARAVVGTAVLATALTSGLASGCGTDTTPADTAPELVERLARVDRAVAGGDDARIRKQVESLVEATESARAAGRVDDEQAGRILAAAAAVLRRLPEPTPTPEPQASPATSSPTPSPTPASPPGGEGDDEEDEEDEEVEDDEDDEEGGGRGPDDKGKPKGKGKGKGHQD